MATRGYADGSDVQASGDGGVAKPLALRQLIAAVRHRWWLVLGVFGITVAIMMWRTVRKPRLYRATATVRVQETPPPMQGFGTPQVRDYRIDPIQTEQQVIRSYNVAERVVEQLGLRLGIVAPTKLPRSELFGEIPPRVDSAVTYADFILRLRDTSYALYDGADSLGAARYGSELRGGGVRFTLLQRPRVDGSEVALRVIPPDNATGAVRGGIGTRPVTQTNIVEISYTGTDPATVRQIANALAIAYKEYSMEARRAAARARTAFIRTSLESQQDSLVSAQERLRQFKETQKISSVTAEQNALIANISSFESELDRAKVQRTQYLDLLGGLSQADTATEQLRKLSGTDAIRNNPYLAGLFQSWFDALKTKQELFAGGKTEVHADVRAADAVIRQAKVAVRSASGDYLEGLESTIRSIETRVAGLRQELAKYPSLGAQEDRLSADVKTAQATYDYLQSELQRARIAESGEEGYVHIVDPASQPTAPISPNRRRAFITAVMLGLMLGLATALGVEHLDDSVKALEEIRDGMELPVLGSIPRIGEGKSGRDGRDGNLVAYVDPRSPVAEAYRSLRTNVAYARASRSLRTLVLTSPGPADGKSTTVANLAITFAQQGQRTLLVDADLRRAVLEKFFDAPRSPGLTNVLVGEATFAQAVRETAIQNLYMLASGPFPPNPAELLGSSAMRDLLAIARETYDIVLLDSPPLLAVTDAAVLSMQADGAVLVVRMGATARAAVRRALGHLEGVRASVIGAVLNDVDFRHSGYAGGYGYAYYYYHYYGEDGGRNGHGVLGRIKQWTRQRAQRAGRS